MVFGRVYNAPTPAEATFYADSKAVTLPTRAKSDLVLEFDPARPIDRRDDDGDGLENSWESLLGIDDRPTPDYDGDGMSDLHEWLAGIGPETGEPYAFELVREVVAGEGEYQIDVWVDVEDNPTSTFRVKLVTE